MDSLQDLLGAYSPKEPPEVLAIKRYIQETFNSGSAVGVKDKLIVVTVASGSLASTLRFHVSKLQAAAKTEKPIVLRIG